VTIAATALPASRDSATSTAGVTNSVPEPGTRAILASVVVCFLLFWRRPSGR
jgi:hypothetical protein